jgi:Uma2 family endonuclease
MTTLMQPPKPGEVTSPAIRPEQRVLLYNVEWKDYEAIGTALSNRPNLRLTYDRGRLEFMTLSPEHERRAYLLGRLIDALTEELDLPVMGFGSTTYKRAETERGLEPDQCYYFENLDRVRGVMRLDLSRDPPPDLAVEIDVTHSSIDRMGIYAALGIPEVWRLSAGTLQAYRLTAGKYEAVERSPRFPALPLGELVRFLAQGESEDATAMVRAFRAWVREQLSRPA